MCSSWRVAPSRPRWSCGRRRRGSSWPPARGLAAGQGAGCGGRRGSPTAGLACRRQPRGARRWRGPAGARTGAGVIAPHRRGGQGKTNARRGAAHLPGSANEGTPWIATWAGRWGGQRGVSSGAGLPRRCIYATHAGGLRAPPGSLAGAAGARPRFIPHGSCGPCLCLRPACPSMPANAGRKPRAHAYIEGQALHSTGTAARVPAPPRAAAARMYDAASCRPRRSTYSVGAMGVSGDRWRHAMQHTLGINAARPPPLRRCSARALLAGNCRRCRLLGSAVQPLNCYGEPACHNSPAPVHSTRI
jgi:hypothetical protein